MILIKRVLNNNAVVAIDEKGQTLVALGGGIAFQRKAGQTVPTEKIEKAFYSKSVSDTDRISQTLANIEPWYIELSDRIISEISTGTDHKVSDDIYVNLPDHLQFAVQRLKHGIPIENRLTLETMSTYPDEFALGKQTIKALEKKTGLHFPEAEAANIAMHLITAEEGDSLENTEGTIELIDRIIQVIEEMLQKQLDTNSVSYYRLMTHLKFFIKRIKTQNSDKGSVDADLFNMAAHKYHEEYLF